MTNTFTVSGKVDTSQNGSQSAGLLQNGSWQSEHNLKGQFRKLFHFNETVKNYEYSVHFRKDKKTSKQEGCRKPMHIQAAVKKEVANLMAKGHFEKFNEVGEDAFLSPVVITHKNDGAVKVALDSIELKKQIIKRKTKPKKLRRRMQLPLLAELLDQISMKKSGNRGAQLYIWEIDLKYPLGNIALHKETSKHFVATIVGGKATSH